MSILAIVGLILAVAVLIVGAYKGLGALPLTLLASLVVIVTNGIPIWDGYADAYMKGYTGAYLSFFLLFASSSLYAELMNFSGCATTIGNKFIDWFGKAKVMLVSTLIISFLTYGGVSLFVVVFAVGPIMFLLFKEADLPRHLTMACLITGSATYTMTSMPGTPALTNVIPTQFLGTTLTAAPIMGILATIATFTLCMLYMNYAEKKARANGEHWSYPDKADPALFEVKDRSLLPSPVKAFLPIVSLMLIIIVGSHFVNPQGSGDNSNSQFALLALHEAECAGVQVSEKTWRLAQAYWEDCQNSDGSWGYYKRALATGSMTCAGITSLVITSDKIDQPDAKAAGEKIQCCGQGESEAENRVEKALYWLGVNFSVSRNPGYPGGLWSLYYLYGLERAGRLTSQRFIGKADWYREGAKHLIDSQDKLSGFWSGSGLAEDSRLVGTSFALLFLSKGRWPVLISKLKHPPSDDWNQHRHDLNNLTRFVESRWKKDLTWQVVDLRLASVEDLLQSPILFLCGSASSMPNDPEMRKELARKLRDYIDRGGFLFAEAYCGDSGFDKGFRELMSRVFPEPEYRLRLLEPEHPIWHAEEIVSPEQLRPLWGIDFGCRTSVVYAPLDPANDPRPSLSCLWELARSGRGQTFQPSIQAQIDAALGLGINVMAYATNRELRGKEEYFQSQTQRQPGEQAQRGRLYIAKIRHPGGCNTAPRALVNLLDLAGRELKIHASVRNELINITDDAMFDYHLAFMQGRNAFRFTDAEREQLKKYIERGGMLFADSICASRAFSESFRREMATIFPQNKLERIPLDDPLLSTKFGGFDLKIVTRRDPQNRGANAPLSASLKKVPPDLEGIKFDDRWGVIFSQYDISCALEKLDSLECRGYIREDAARIGLNVILYSLQQ